MPGVFNGVGATEAHRQVAAHQNRCPLPLPRPRSNCTLPIAEEGESTAGEGASGEGASSQGGGRMEDLYNESDLDMTEV